MGKKTKDVESEDSEEDEEDFDDDHPGPSDLGSASGNNSGNLGGPG